MVKLAKITRKMAIEVLLGLTFILGGLLLLLFTYTSFEGVEFANVWARRFYTFLALGLVSAGYALSWTGTIRKLVAFIASFLLLNLVFLIYGGINLYDANNPDPNAFWGVYDTSFADVGLGIKLIGDAAANIVPLALLCIIIYQVLYAGEADEATKALLEGGICLGFILAYNFVGGLELGTLLTLSTPLMDGIASSVAPLATLPKAPIAFSVIA